MVFFLGKISVKKAKYDPITILERSKSGKKLEIGECRNPRYNSVRSGSFGHWKRKNTAVFQDSDLKLGAHIHRQVRFHIYIVF